MRGGWIVCPENICRVASGRSCRYVAVGVMIRLLPKAQASAKANQGMKVSGLDMAKLKNAAITAEIPMAMTVSLSQLMSANA